MATPKAILTPQKISRVHSEILCFKGILDLSIVSAEHHSHRMPYSFCAAYFYFVTWISVFFFNHLAGIQDYFVQKILKTQVVFKMCKKNETTWTPAGWPSDFNVFLFCTLCNHFGFKISVQNSHDT